MSVCMCLFVYVCVCVCICLCVRMCVCMCVVAHGRWSLTGSFTNSNLTEGEPIEILVRWPLKRGSLCCLGESSLQKDCCWWLLLVTTNNSLSEDYSHPDDHTTDKQLILLGSNLLPYSIPLTFFSLVTLNLQMLHPKVWIQNLTGTPFRVGPCMGGYLSLSRALISDVDQCILINMWQVELHLNFSW